MQGLGSKVRAYRGRSFRLRCFGLRVFCGLGDVDS